MPRCRGTGTDRNRICPQCHGTGRVRETKKFDVTVPRGVREGQRIRLGGQGASGPGGGPRGDLYLIVHRGEDDCYERKGDDLYLDLPDEYVRLIGQLPTNLTDEEHKLFRELAALRNGKR